MKYKIVVDSSADIRTLASIDFASAPLKINIGDRIYVDDASLDVMGMVDALRAYKGRTTTACPNTEEYLASFGDADRVFCITISGNLSGSFNAARLAKEQYEEENPGKKVHVIDSLSAGPELAMIAEKIRDMSQYSHVGSGFATLPLGYSLVGIVKFLRKLQLGESRRGAQIGNIFRNY